MNVIVLVGIDLGVIFLRGETVSLTPRMRDTNYLFIIYLLFINHTLLSVTYTLFFLLWKISLSNAMIRRIKQKSVQFLFTKLGVRDQSNVNGQAIPRSGCSDGERPLWWDQSRTRNNQIVSPSWAERGASWDVGYGSNQLGQIRRCTTIDCMVYQ